MENRAIIENSEFGSIRILEEDGRIYFCGSDAAKILGYANPPAALKRHCRYRTKRYTPHPQSPGKMMSMEFIPEGDLYRLIIHSKLPSAERFERWVFDEVIPGIRRNGAYLTDSLIRQVLEHPELIRQMAETLFREQRKNEQLSAELAETQPKAAYYDAFVASDNCTNLRITAKEIGVPEKRFTRFLQERGYLYRSRSGILLPYARPENQGLFIVRDFYCRRGLDFYTLITPRGKEHLRAMAEQM